MTLALTADGVVISKSVPLCEVWIRKAPTGMLAIEGRLAVLEAILADVAVGDNDSSERYLALVDGGGDLSLRDDAATAVMAGALDGVARATGVLSIAPVPAAFSTISWRTSSRATW